MDACSIAPVFVGFSTLEEWAEALDPTVPVLAMPLVEPSEDHGGLQIDELLVICQQVTGSGQVTYVRLRAASMTCCYGEPFDPDWKDREAAWHSLWELIREWLTAQGVTVHKATVARPKALVFLEGKAGFVSWDTAIKRYVRKEATHAV